MTDQLPALDVSDQGDPDTSTAAPEEILRDLDRLKLLVVFDAILVEGNLGRAAERLGKTSPAMSRHLKQLRAHFGQDLFERTSQGLVPTPFAEELRPRLRALVAEANALLKPTPPRPRAPADPRLLRQPMSLNQWHRPGEGPDALTLAHRIGEAGAEEEPAKRFASYIATIGAGAGQTRPLVEAEAQDAMDLMLARAVPDVQIGAFLAALQARSLTDQELSGFARATRTAFELPAPGTGAVDLDWPSYLTPRSQGVPLHVHAARLVAQTGYRVLMHGPVEGIVHRAFRHAQLQVADSAGAAQRATSNAGLSFLPLQTFAPRLRDLHALYPLFMLPNMTHLLSALLNPAGAATTLAGVAPGCRPGLHRDAARRLGWPVYATLTGKRDVAEVQPGRAQDLLLWRDGAAHDVVLPRTPAQTATSPDRLGLSRLETWQAIWDGTHAGPAEVEAIIETAALALHLLAPAGEESLDAARDQARALWADRRKPR